MIRHEITTDGPLLSVLGDIDFSNVATLADALQMLAAEPVVILSLEHATFIDSTVLSELLGRYRRHEGELVVVVPEGNPIERIFDVTGLRNVLNVVPDLSLAQSLAAAKRASATPAIPAP